MRSGMGSFGYTLQKVFAFFLQRLVFWQSNHLAAVTFCDPFAGFPGNLMCVQYKLFLGFQVVKHSHLLAANNAQLLFLKGMEPANENMSFYPARKLQRAQSRIHNRGIQVTSTLGRGNYWSLRQHLDDYGDIVGRETPQYIFLRTQLAQTQARGINILNLSELPSPHQTN